MPFKTDSQTKRKSLINRISACIALVWLGMILGISFLEAPVKFMVPSVTLEIGLDIGRYVFGAFNKVECVFAIAIAILLIIVRKKDASMVSLILAWLSLVLQTVWLLPLLEARSEVIIQGQTPPQPRLKATRGALTIMMTEEVSGLTETPNVL